MVPIIDSNTPLAAIQNKEEIVQKFFKLNNYTPSQMGQILLPMLGEYGNLSSDDDTRILGVIDTVSTLIRMESVIQQFDIAAAEPMVENIFEIRYTKSFGCNSIASGTYNRTEYCWSIFEEYQKQRRK